MARLALLLDAELGHIYSTFKLARELANNGHDVWYLGYSRSRNLVHKHGFNFKAVYTSLDYPQTAMNGFPWLPLSKRALRSVARAINVIEPEILITLSMFCAEALVMTLKYGKPIILIRNHFNLSPRKRSCREIVTVKMTDSTPASAQLTYALEQCGLSDVSYDSVAQSVIDQMPEIVLLPRAFGVQHLVDKRMTYAGFMVDADRSTHSSFPWASIPQDKRLIYCSFGSHAHVEAATVERFCRILIETMTQCPDAYLILSTGSMVLPSELPVPDNIYITDWAPQIEILGRADMMLNHAGIGTVKECLVKGVGMVVFPLMRDQYRCAERLVQLGLALRGDVRTASVKTLKALIEAGIASQDLRSAAGALRSRCGVDNSLGVLNVVDNVIAEANYAKTSRFFIKPL